uniref:Uncharacterized protein n=1 Tax=Glossina pallidipes TaxID=7398 RepID=A0A1B0AJJ8_GLOPL
MNYLNHLSMKSLSYDWIGVGLKKTVVKIHVVPPHPESYAPLDPIPSNASRTCDNVLLPGERFRPFELVMHRGEPRESKNKRRLVALAMRSLGGNPNTSIIQANCSTSFSPGNNGNPVDIALNS